jgi:7-cyano-7-deazaguanine synthase
VITGLSHFCEAAHIGLPAAEGQDGRLFEFVHAFDIAIESLSPRRSRVRIDAPLIDLTCAQIIKLGRRFGVPFEKTWTCAQPGPRPCGSCEPCRSRERGFLEAALVDPLSMPEPTHT